MKRFNLPSFRLSYLILVLSLLGARSAHAVTITWVSFSPPTIANETTLPNGTTIDFTIDTPGDVEITVSKVQNFGDPGTPVATLNATYIGSGLQHIFWNGLWLINGAYGRLNGNYSFELTLSTTSGNSTATPAALVQINSVDIHNMSVTPSFDANNAPTFPYIVAYSLAKESRVTAIVYDSSDTVVRTLLSNKLQLGEPSISTQTVTWDGLSEEGQPAPIGLYHVILGAIDPASGDSAIERTLAIAVQSLAGSAEDSQKVFEENVYVFPNPVRNGLGTFHVLPVRDNAAIRLRIYTMTGDLVLDRDITGQIEFPWNITNQAGNKVGRGLYYYVVREEDAQGTLQTVKKMVVLP